MASFLGELSPAWPLWRGIVAWAHTIVLDDSKNGLCRSILWHHLLTILEQPMCSSPIAGNVSCIGLPPIYVELLVVLFTQVCEVRILPNVTNSGHGAAFQTLPEHKLLTIQHSLLLLHHKLLETVRHL